MPWKITPLKTKKDRYKVTNAETGRVLAKNTTKKKAEAQVRMLIKIEINKMKNKPRAYQTPRQNYYATP